MLRTMVLSETRHEAGLTLLRVQGPPIASLLSQCVHRVHLRGAAGGEVTCQKSRTSHNSEGEQVDRRIAGTDFEENAGHQLQAGESESETCQQVGDSVPPTRPLCSGVVELTWLGV